MRSPADPQSALHLLAEVRAYDRILSPELAHRVTAQVSDLPAGPLSLDNRPPEVPSPMYMRTDSEGQRALGLTSEELD